jgi:hypothetical protein
MNDVTARHIEAACQSIRRAQQVAEFETLINAGGADEGRPCHDRPPTTVAMFQRALKLRDELWPERSDEDAVREWLNNARRRLVDDNDAIADVDLLYGLYTALTGEEIPHPYEENPVEESGYDGPVAGEGEVPPNHPAHPQWHRRDDG